MDVIFPDKFKKVIRDAKQEVIEMVLQDGTVLGPDAKPVPKPEVKPAEEKLAEPEKKKTTRGAGAKAAAAARRLVGADEEDDDGS